MPDYRSKNSGRVLVVLPNWVGDVVLATPVLAALRGVLADAHIAYLMRAYVAEVVAGGGWHDAEYHWPTARGWRGMSEMLGLASRLRAERFDTALLLPNSFRSAATVFFARVPQRVGYARDGRTLLLTRRLRPERRNGAFVPGSVLPYYAKLAAAIGCAVTDWKLRLRITPEQERAGAALQQHYRLTPRCYAVLNPGAAYGAAKCWPAERFAALADVLRREHELTPVFVGAPGEVPLMRAIARAAQEPVVICANPGTTLGSLKPLIRDAAVLVCNDTGPRHYGNAFDIPTVTLFGPTHQAWTATNYAGETRLQVETECGPCQLRTCPIDHRCMTGLGVATVVEAVRAALARGRISLPATPAAQSS